MSAPEVTIGRIVHYFLPKDCRNAGQLRAALVTGVSEPGRPNLMVFLDSPLDLRFPEGVGGNGSLPLRAERDVPYSPEREPGCWSWPVREVPS